MNAALLERIAVALESIAGSLERISKPPQVGHLPPWKGDLLPGKITYWGSGTCVFCGAGGGEHHPGCPNGNMGVQF